MKKRSCRRTKAEDAMHDQAVRLRKMTDEQLVGYIRDKETAAYENGRQRASEELSATAQSVPQEMTASELIQRITNDKIPGIGSVTINKIWKAARRYGIAI